MILGDNYINYFENECGGFNVSMLRERFLMHNAKNVVTDVVTERHIELSARQKLILNTIESDHLHTAQSLAKKFVVTARTIQRELSVLRKNGFIKKSGKSNNSPWIVLKNVSPLKK